MGANATPLRGDAWLYWCFALSLRRATLHVRPFK